MGLKSKLLICEENYHGVKVKITNLQRKLLICEEKSRVKVQITNLRRKKITMGSKSKLLICEENQSFGLSPYGNFLSSQISNLDFDLTFFFAN